MSEDTSDMTTEVSAEEAGARPWVFFLCTALVFVAAVIVIVSRLPRPREVVPSDVLTRLQALEASRQNSTGLLDRLERAVSTLQAGLASKAEEERVTADLASVRQDLESLRGELQAGVRADAARGDRLDALERRMQDGGPGGGDEAGWKDPLAKMAARLQAVEDRAPVDLTDVSQQVVAELKKGDIGALLPPGVLLAYDPVVRLGGKRRGFRNIPTGLPHGWESTDALGDRFLRATPEYESAGEADEADRPPSYRVMFIRPKPASNR